MIVSKGPVKSLRVVIHLGDHGITLPCHFAVALDYFKIQLGN